MSDAAQAAPLLDPLLVVGAGGGLGRAVMAHLRAAPSAPTTLITSRTPGAPLFVDLTAAPDTWRLPESPQAATPVRAALLLAALTGVAACESDPLLARRVNVDALLTLARRLAARGFFLVFPSTSQVFDGASSHAAGLPRPNDPTSPQTAYGRHKAQAEAQLLAEFPDHVAVLRITKVLDADNWLIRRWVAAFLRGEEAGAFVDMCMAPVSETLAAAALLGLAQARRPGVFQLSASRDMTYFEAARLGAETLGLDPSLARPEHYAERCAGREIFAPEHTALFVAPGSLPGLGPGIGPGIEPGLAPGGACPEPEAAVRRAFALAGAALSRVKPGAAQRQERP
ncbi:MAG: hypothetical protein C0405_00615 [Desulfovibrio sp.]|nr:hypothetical protein [Desulfovibrio sp.]